MTGEFFLDWAIMAVSLLNTILLLWLGLTVLLNAERRVWGVWLAGGGLLMGAAFFLSHSAIMGLGLNYMGEGLNFWWHVSWIPVISAPFAWYVVMLWYGGFWDDTQVESAHALRRRQRPWFVVSILLSLMLLGLLIFANPLPYFSPVQGLYLITTPSFAGVPIVILIYSLFIVLCMMLSLDVLRRPALSTRLMTQVARRRARPWLFATSLVLLVVTVLVAAVMVWVVLSPRRQEPYTIFILSLARYDLLISSLIAVAIILLGNAVVSYEIFTGRTLPRRGFFRQWRNAVFLGIGYGVVVGWSLALELRPLYSLLLTTLLMTVFYALLSWRAHSDRKRYMDQLSPFIASQQLYDHLLTPGNTLPPDLVPVSPFRALCRDVLGARRATLIPLGPLAPLVGPPLVFPEEEVPIPTTNDIVAQFNSPRVKYIALDPTRHGGMLWGVPLWSDRGLIGVLQLGEKRDGGLYTEEEIELAQASGERLIDTQASAELARRLMALQRQRLAESQVLDQRARRVLHDDVLPRLHTALLSLSVLPASGDGAIRHAQDLMADVHRQISDLLRELPLTATPEVAQLGLLGALQRALNEEWESAFDGVSWNIEAEAEERARLLPALTGEVIYYAAREAIRNAARYGRDGVADRPLHLSIRARWQEGLQLSIEDDGTGLDTARSKAGNGQGLALHSTMMAVVGGSLAVESLPGQFTRVVLTLSQL